MNSLVPFSGSLRGVKPEPGGMMATFDLSTDAGKFKAFRLVQGKDSDASDHVNEPFLLADVIVHWVPRADEKTGEVSLGLRVVMLTSEGIRIATSSESVLNGLQELATLLGRPKAFDPPVAIVIRKAKSATTGHNYLTVDIP